MYRRVCWLCRYVLSVVIVSSECEQLLEKYYFGGDVTAIALLCSGLSHKTVGGLVKGPSVSSVGALAL